MSNTSILFPQRLLPLITLLSTTHHSFRGFLFENSYPEQREAFINWPNIEGRWNSDLYASREYKSIKKDTIFDVLADAQIPYSVHCDRYNEFVTPVSNNAPPVSLGVKRSGALVNYYNGQSENIPSIWVDKLIEVASYEGDKKVNAIEFIKDKRSFYQKEHNQHAVADAIYEYLTSEQKVPAKQVMKNIEGLMNGNTRPITAFLAYYQDNFISNSEPQIERNLKGLLEASLNDKHLLADIIDLNEAKPILSNALLEQILASKDSGFLAKSYTNYIIDNFDKLNGHHQFLVSNIAEQIASNKLRFSTSKEIGFISHMSTCNIFKNTSCKQRVESACQRLFKQPVLNNENNRNVMPSPSATI